jgi:hypothetical protein
MDSESVTIEGTWEQVMSLSSALKGRRVRVIVAPEPPTAEPTARRHRLIADPREIAEAEAEFDDLIGRLRDWRERTLPSALRSGDRTT